MTAPAPAGDPSSHLDRRAAARPLLRRAAASGPEGLVGGIDPATAGWNWTTFHVCRPVPGQAVARPADEMERLVLVAEGGAAFRAGDEVLDARACLINIDHR